MKKTLFIINFLFSLIILGQTPEELKMIDLINTIRTNPKSFIPDINNYIISIKNLNKFGGFSNKKTGESIDVIYEANKLINFLDTIKPVDSVFLSIKLYSITKKFARYLDSTKQLSHIGPNKNETIFMRTKSSGLICGENLVKGNMKQALIILLLDIGNKEKGHRTTIFDNRYTRIAVGNSNNTWVQDFGFVLKN